MANTTIEPAAGSLTIPAYDPVKAPLLDHDGNTFSSTTTTLRYGLKLSNKALVGMLFTTSLATHEFGLTTVKGIGYLPPGVTVVGFMVKSTDLDTGTPALVQSLYIGSTEAVTGITVGQGGTGAVYPCTPTDITTATELKLKTTTRAATRAAGTVYVTALYYST